VGETLDQTRLEIEAQRVQLQRTADRLKARARRTVDLKAKFKENPALFVGLGAGAIFLVAGGPMRAARFARRRLMRSTPEKAYDTLPKPMQSWVDTLAGSVGPRAERARETLAEELREVAPGAPPGSQGAQGADQADGRGAAGTASHHMEGAGGRRGDPVDRTGAQGGRALPVQPAADCPGASGCPCISRCFGDRGRQLFGDVGWHAVE